MQKRVEYAGLEVLDTALPAEGVNDSSAKYSSIEPRQFKGKTNEALEDIY
jgi:hypothetical protein